AERRRLPCTPAHRRTSPPVRTGLGTSRHGARVTDAIGQRAIARVRRRLIPFLATMYFVAYLDRVNVGFAALQMNAALGFSGRVYGLGAGIFFLGYFLFEIPSNLALAKVGARLWIARIAIVWGLVSISMLLVRGP